MWWHMEWQWGLSACWQETSLERSDWFIHHFTVIATRARFWCNSFDYINSVNFRGPRRTWRNVFGLNWEFGPTCWHDSPWTCLVLRNSASSFHRLSSSIFTCLFVVCRPSRIVTSPLISTIWCFRPYKPYILHEDMILAMCHHHHMIIWWSSYIVISS